MRRRDLLITAAGLPVAASLGGALPATSVAAEMADPPMLPKGFAWGASTSAYQIEGAVAEDGRRPSIWDTFAQTPGRIADGSTGDVACDHYHRYREDVALLAKGGFNAYRFSVSWPRVIPTGTGAVNPQGLDFYDRLVDSLLEATITPWGCLYHWDLPQVLQDRGGWTNRDIAQWFTDYTRAVIARLGDRVRHWAMFNEPNIHAIFGHGLGNHAPGLTGKANWAAAQHHQNLAQGTALEALRTEKTNLVLGTVLSLQPIYPSTTAEKDVAAARRFDAVWNRTSLDPLFHGRYPQGHEATFAPLIKDGDLKQIRQKVDFLGVNYYSASYVVDDPNGFFDHAGFGPLPSGTPVTALGWPVVPEGLVEILTDLKARYGNPVLYVTENGACDNDPAPVNGTVADPKRTAYIEAHLAAATRAITQGADLRGYFVWSILDNFEWAEGFSRRFGIVHVDFTTQERLPKQSYGFLARVIAAQKR